MMKNMLKIVPLIFLVFVIPTLISCRPEPVAPEEPRILIIEPSADSTVSPPNITVKTFVDFFTLANKTGQPAVYGEGHIIYYIDVTPPMKAGEPALTASGTYFSTTDKVHVWENVSAGRHTFYVQLVNNDDTPLEPAAVVRAPVTVR